MLRLLVLWTAVALSSGTPAALKLHKCCPYGQYLQSDSVCKPDLYSEDWMPLIYSSGPNGGFKSKTPDNVDVTPAWRPVCPDGSLPVHLQSPDNSVYVLLENEVLSLLMLHHQGEHPPIFAPEDFCVDRQAALVCNAPVMDGVRKCCGQDAAYSEEQGACVHTQRFSAQDEIYSVAKATGFPLCPQHQLSKGTYVIGGELEGNLTLALNGTVLQLAPPPAAPLDKDDYCLERVLERPNLVSVFTCVRDALLPDIRPVDEVYEDDIRLTLYPAGLAISAFFLAATLATSFLLPKAHHALHWRCQTCHVACLLIADIVLAAVQFSGRSIPEEACVTMGEHNFLLLLIVLFRFLIPTHCSVLNFKL